MFFDKDRAAELQKMNTNLQAQSDLLNRQLEKGEITKEDWHEQQQRLSTIRTANTKYIESATSNPAPGTSP